MVGSGQLNFGGAYTASGQLNFGVVTPDLPVNVASQVRYRCRLTFGNPSATDIQEDVLQTNIVRNIADIQDSLRAGVADFVLCNDDGRYSTLNNSSDLFGLLGLNTPIQFSGVFTSSGGILFELDIDRLDNSAQLSELHPLFTGNVQEINVDPRLDGPRNATLRCQDNMEQFLNRQVSTDILTNVGVSSAFTEVLNEANIPLRSIDPIDRQLGFFWVNKLQLGTTLDDMIFAGDDKIFMSPTNVLNIKNRVFELGKTPVAFYDEMFDLRFSINDRDLFNQFVIQSQPREIVSDVVTLSTLIEVLTVPASQSVGFFLDYFDPFNNEISPAINLVTPVASLDYETNTASDGTGIVVTNSLVVTIAFFAESAVQTLTNPTGTDMFVTRYQLRGNPIRRQNPFTVTFNDETSQSSFGVKELTLSSRFMQGRDFVEDYGDYLLELKSRLRPNIGLSIRNDFPNIFTTQLSDILTIQNSFLNINSGYTVFGIEHSISADVNGWVHDVNYDIKERIFLNAFTLNSSEDGILNEDRLGLS